jgi:hypothetical protein
MMTSHSACHGGRHLMRGRHLCVLETAYRTFLNTSWTHLLSGLGDCQLWVVPRAGKNCGRLRLWLKSLHSHQSNSGGKRCCVEFMQAPAGKSQCGLPGLWNKAMASALGNRWPVTNSSWPATGPSRGWAACVGCGSRMSLNELDSF